MNVFQLLTINVLSEGKTLPGWAEKELQNNGPYASHLFTIRRAFFSAPPLFYGNYQVQLESSNPFSSKRYWSKFVPMPIVFFSFIFFTVNNEVIKMGQIWAQVQNKFYLLLPTLQQWKAIKFYSSLLRPSLYPISFSLSISYCFFENDSMFTTHHGR